MTNYVLVGIVLASLPQPDTCQCLLLFLFEYLPTIKERVDDEHIGKQHQALLAIIHTFFGYASLESLCLLKEFLASLTAPQSPFEIINVGQVSIISIHFINIRKLVVFPL